MLALQPRQAALPERSDRRGMGAGRAAQSARQAGWRQAAGQPARGGQRGDVYPEHRLPVALSAQEPAAAGAILSRPHGAPRNESTKRCPTERMARPVRKGFGTPALISLRQRIPPRGTASDQDGDPRSPVLIITAASEAIQWDRFPCCRSTVRPSCSHHPRTSTTKRRRSPPPGQFPPTPP